MNDRVQAALKAREKEKDKKKNRVSEALSARKTAMESDFSTASSTWGERIKSTAEAYDKHLSSSEWGSDFLQSARQTALDTESLINEISAYRKYLGGEKTDEIVSYLNSIKDNYNLRSSFDSEASFNAYVEERKAIDAILNAEDFEEYYNLGLNAENPSWYDVQRDFGTDIANKVTYAEKYGESAIRHSGARFGSGGYSDIREAEHIGLISSIHNYMRDDEKKVYNYYIGKGDAQKAEEYLNSLADKFEQRAAGEWVAEWDETPVELLFSFAAGTMQFIEGAANLVSFAKGTEDVTGTSRLEYAKAWMSSNNDGVWGVANDLATTTGNMLPSILVGSLTGGLGGALTMGASATGNAYADMRNQGYTANQARAYAGMVGVSEAALQYALGGISKLGGKTVNKVAGDLVAKYGTKFTTAIAGIDNAIARIAVEYGGQMLGKMGSEAFEESLQSVLEPMFKTIVTGENLDIDWSEVAYSGLLGALSAGFLEGGTTLAGTIYNDVSTTKYGQSLIDSNSVPELQALARDMMGVSNETDMLSINAKTKQTAHNVGEFALSLGESVNSQNLTEVTNALVEKGLSQKEAQKVAEKLINSEGLSKKQMSNEAIKAVAEEVVNNPASAMNERNAKLRNAQLGVKTNASGTEVAVNKKVDVKDRVSADGVTKLNSTGEAITIDKSNPIAKTEDGKVYFNTDKGVVESSDVSYASADEGLIYEAFVDMNPAFANALIRNYDGKTPVQSYIKGMREGVVLYGKHNFQGVGKDISGATYFAELSEADQAFALKLGRNYATHEAKVKDAPVRQMIREATKRANTEGANKTAKTGTVGFEKGINKHLLNKEQRGVGELANHLVKALGIDIVFYDARTKKEGENGYNDNGFYDPETNTIHLDLQKSHYDNKTIAYTLSHELVHWLKAKSATDFNNFAKFLMEQYAEHGVDTEKLLDKWIEKGYTADEAYEEMICDACETLLLDSNAVVKLMKLREQDMGLFERIKLHIAEILNKLRNMYKKYDGRLSDEAKALRSMTDVLEQIYEKFEDAMVGAAKNAEVMGVSMEFTVNDAMTGTDISDITKKPTVKMQEKTEYFKFPKEVIKITKSGSERTPMDIKINGKRFTGEASVRELRNARFAENKFDPKIVEKINNFLDKMREYLVEAREKYVYVGLKDIYEAKIIISPTTGSIVLSGLVNNGDYEINFDFTKTCKKKIALQEVIEQLAREKGTKNEDGTQTEVNLSEENIRHINEVLAANGIETACLCCFVESKRYAIQSHFQEKVCDVWNRLVDEVNAEDGITKEAPYFNFADQNVNDSKIPDAEYDRLYADLDRWRNYKFEDDGEGEGAVERKMKAFLINTPNARKKLRLADFVTESGRTNLHKLYPDIESLAKAKIGTALPKAIEAFAPYNGEIELLTVTDKKGLADYTMRIAGARSQSFSDYLMSHVYDVLQKTASLSARKLTAHTYTKEISRARLFGMTGEKTNMSVLHEIDPNVDSWNAGLHEDGSYFVSDYEAFKNGKCGQIQSIPDTESIALQNTEGYSKDCGRIGVGFSYTHMLKMHNDPDIRQTIGYHTSSLPAVLKPLTNLDKAADYTPVQNTLNFNGFQKPNFDIPDGIPSYATPPQDIEPWFKTTKKGKQSTQRMSKYSKSDATFDIKGTYAELCETMDSTKAAKETLRQLLQFAEDNGLALVTSKYKKGGRGGFDLYTDTQKTQNPYLSADHYIEYCISNGLIPMFYEFALNDNYYKDIYDFNPFDRLSYNPETGLHEDSADRKAYAPQNPVHMVNEDGTMAFPDDFWELVDKYMRDYNYQREDFAKKFPKIMKEVRAIKDAEGIPMVSKSGIKKQVKKSAFVSADEIAPLHEVRDVEKYSYLIESMRRDGWQGRPILAVKGEPHFALTGTHRLYAALEAGVDIPVHFVETDNEDVIYDLLDAKDDFARLRILREHFDEVDAESIRLMEVEELSNDEQYDDEEGYKKIRHQKKRPITPLSSTDYTKLEKHFGTTTNYEVAGYLLENGKMLDFSGKHWGDDYSTSRHVDHRDVWEVWENKEKEGVDEMVNMIGNGNIRLMPEVGGINLAVAPNKEQIQTLCGYIRHFHGEVIVDVDEVGGDTIHSFTYNRGTAPMTVIREVMEYFEDGVIPQPQPEYRKFLYQKKKLSNRTILANALETTTDTSTQAGQNELRKLKEYQGVVTELDNLETHLADVMQQIHDISFTKGSDRSKLPALNDDKIKTQNRIHVYDKQLTKLESMKPIQDVLAREKEAVRVKTEAKAKEAFDAYKEQIQTVHEADIGRERAEKRAALNKLRERHAQLTRDLMNRHQASTKKGIENRNKTALKRKLRKVIGDLNKIFSHGTKERNVKKGAQDAVASALALGEILFSDEISNADIVTLGVDSVTEKESKWLNEYRDALDMMDVLLAENEVNKAKYSGEELVKRMNDIADKIGKLQNKINRLNTELSDVFKRERARLNRSTVASLIDQLAKDYKSLASAEEEYLKNAFEEKALAKIEQLSEDLGGTLVKDMSLDQLEEVYKVFKMVKHMVTEANKLFRDGKTEDLMQRVSGVQRQLLWSLKLGKKDPMAKSENAKNLLKDFWWNEMKPLTAFEALGSDAFKELFWDAVKADGEFAKLITEAGTYLQEQREKCHYADWDINTVKEFTLADGKVFKLTLGDIMSIYAYTKRDQAYDHMTNGGFTFDENNHYKGKLFNFKNKNSITEILEKLRVERKHAKLTETYLVDDAILNEIVKLMYSKEYADIKAYTDAMQEYFKGMAQKGNEISNTLYGIDLFGEEFYIPLQSSSDYMNSTKEALNNAETQVSLKNMGMTKATKPHASNPIVLRQFDELWLDHIDKMSKYCAYVLPIENLQRVFNNVASVNGQSPISTKALIASIFGNEARDYIDQYITDLNGGAKGASGYKNPLMSMFAKFKKTAVGAKLSVVIQQPFAILRAMSEIRPDYFVPFLHGISKTQGIKVYEELKKYAPVAILKEMGGFDIGSSGSVKSYIGTTEYHGLKGKAKGLIKDADYRSKAIDDSFMFGATKMDELGWSIIWLAVKKEVAAERGLTPGTDEFFEACGERFQEVVLRTQVYDSVNSRSGMMRSKSDATKFATSFAGEPTTIVNMYIGDIIRLVNAYKFGEPVGKHWAKIARDFGVITASIVITTLAKTAIYANYDDDEDESWTERWMRNFGDSLTSDLNPLTMLPFVRDLVSIWEGWTIERPDMALLADLTESVRSIFDDIQEGAVTMETVYDLIGDMANALGIPAKNIVKDTKGIVNVIKGWFDPIKTIDTGDAFKRGWLGESQSKSDALYEAIINGAKSEIEYHKKSYKTDNAYKLALRQGLRDNDSRIQEAAIAHMEGDVSKRVSIIREIMAEGYFTQDVIQGAVNNEVQTFTTNITNAIKAKNNGDEAEYKKIVKALREKYPKDFIEKKLGEPLPDEEEKETEDKEISFYSMEDYYNTILDGDAYTLSVIKEDILKTDVANGKDRDEAESSFNTKFASYLKDEYTDGNLNSRNAINMLVEYGGKSEDEAKAKVQYWDFKLTNPDSDLTESAVTTYYEKVEPSGISVEVYEEYTKKRAKCKGTDSDGDGKTDSGSKQAEVLKVINSLPITKAQKDALYLAEGYAKSNLYKTPWH